MPTASLTLRKILPCPADVAFRAWTEPAQFESWFAPHPDMKVKAKFNLRRGGKYRITFLSTDDPAVIVNGEFLVIDRPHRLEYTWIWDKACFPEWGGCHSVVKVAFNPLPRDRTEIVLTHEQLTNPEARKSHARGWTKILANMRKALRRSAR